jgi:hypothetical protein
MVVQELSDRDMANYSMVGEHLIEILSKDVIILMTEEAYFWLCQQTEFLLLGMVKSTAASSTTSS